MKCYCNLFFMIALFWIYPNDNVSALSALSEPSGITWSESTGNYYIVGDEGFLYVLDRSFNVINSVYLGAYDLEAISYNPRTETLFCLVETDLTLLEVDMHSLRIINTFNLELERTKNRNYQQFESLVFVPSADGEGGLFYIGASVEKKNKQFGILFSVSLDELKLIPLVDLPLWDISGLCYFGDNLYMVSDDRDVVASFSLTDESFEHRSVVGDHQEGIFSFGNKGLIILDENGSFYILKNTGF